MTTPLYNQYIQIKKLYPDHLVLMKIGDFVGALDADAHTLALALGMSVQTRRMGRKLTVDMAGFPFVYTEERIATLLEAGYRVALAEPIPDIKDKGHSIYETKEVANG